MKKKFIEKSVGLLLTICVIGNTFPTQVFAEEKVEISDITEDETSIGEYGGYLSGNTKIIQKIQVDSNFASPKGGHGFAAEQGNNQLDVWSGKNARVVGGDNAKNGADRLIIEGDGNNTLIQTKYHATASSSIADCFDETGMFRYLDADGNPMQIEVPSNQYDEAIELLKKRIVDGKVPSISDPNDAQQIIRKGNLSYDQAKYLTVAGNIDSLKYDARNGTITASSAMGITFAIDFVLCQMSGMSLEDSLENASLNGVKTGGVVFATSVISSQLAKTGAKNALVPTAQAITDALGDDVSRAIVNSFGNSTSNLTGKALTKQAADILSNTLLVDGIMIVVLTTDDVVDLFHGKISKEQLIKNVSIAVIGVAGGTVGTFAGGAAGSAVAPGVGTAVGGVVGGAIGGAGATFAGEQLISLLYAGDAEIMMNIISTEFEDMSVAYLIDEVEGAKITEQLQLKLDGETLQEMYASEDREEFARELMNPIFESEIQQRETIEFPTEEMVRAEMKEMMQGVVFIH